MRGSWRELLDKICHNLKVYSAQDKQDETGRADNTHSRDKKCVQKLLSIFKGRCHLGEFA
jgi:hypothetical protein